MTVLLIHKNDLNFWQNIIVKKHSSEDNLNKDQRLESSYIKQNFLPRVSAIEVEGQATY